MKLRLWKSKFDQILNETQMETKKNYKKGTEKAEK